MESQLLVGPSAEKIVVCQGNRPTGLKRLMILGHGVNGLADAFLGTPGMNTLMTLLAHNGFIAVTPDLAGTVAWGNDAAKAAVAAAWTWAKANLAVKTDKFVSLGYSMGNIALATYAAANPTQVAAHIGVIPVCDLDDIHDNNRGGYAAAIETAHGGLAAYDAGLPTHNPAAVAAAFKGAVPARLYVSDNDPICVPAAAASFAAASGATIVSTGANGHNSVGTDPAAVTAYAAAFR